MTGTTASPLDRHVSPVREGRRTGRAVAALVVGIIAVIAFILPIFGVILGIIAVSLGLAARGACRRASRSTPWQATAGWVLGAVAVVASVANVIAGVAMHH